MHCVVRNYFPAVFLIEHGNDVGFAASVLEALSGSLRLQAASSVPHSRVSNLTSAVPPAERVARTCSEGSAAAATVRHAEGNL